MPGRVRLSFLTQH